MKRLLLFFFLEVSICGNPMQPSRADDYDLVVIEATPGGIAMAVRAAREGLTVLLVNRTQHLGGILANGLGVWDTLHEGRRSPIYDEVRQAVFDHYRDTYGERSPQYLAALPGKSGHTNGRFEPKVAEKILTELVAKEGRITVQKGYVPLSIERDGRLIRSITMKEVQGQAVKRITAAMFADCTYEGDLMPLAGVAYRVGRETQSEFNEPHAGKVYMRASKTPPDENTARLAALHDSLKLRKFPGFQEIIEPESNGEGDRNVQAFNYRTILTSDPANRLPVGKPTNYDPKHLAALEFGSIVSPLPNQKIGWNRPQLIGPHQAYVEGDWPARLKVMDQHWQATMGLLYYLQNDPSVPDERRRFFGAYGLAKDEFEDHGHRPQEFYVREARRLTGRHVITQHDLMLARETSRAPVYPDSIAMAEWYIDTHACMPGKVKNSLDEGKMMLHHETFPGQIPYRSLLPPDLDNLIVPLCLSATHVAWGAIRLEPTWMQIGESAGYACALARSAKLPPSLIDTDQLVLKLVQGKSMVGFFNDVDVSQKDSATTAAEYFSTQGYFHDYDARLSDPLKVTTAAVWTRAMTKEKNDAEAQETTREVAEAESKDSTPMTRSEWQRMRGIANSLADDAGNLVVTRGAALMELFKTNHIRR